MRTYSLAQRFRLIFLCTLVCLLTGFLPPHAPQTAVVTAASNTLSLEYRAGDYVPDDIQIMPDITIINGTSSDVPLSELTIRYWYTIDGDQPQTYNCDYAITGCSHVTGQFVPLDTPVTGADYYLEIGFTATAATLPAGGSSSELRSRFNKTDWSTYAEGDDYSYDGTKTAYTAWDQMTLYQDGQLVWGIEPVGTNPTPPEYPRPPTPLTVPATPGSARAALLDALQRVAGLDYPAAPAAAPACTTTSIQRDLLTALDGKFVSDNYLGDTSAYADMRSAATCLTAIAGDTQATPEVQQEADLALQAVVLAARLIPDRTLDGTNLFGSDLPTAIADTLQQAEQELTQGDAQVSAGQLVAAFDPYRAAWLLVTDALDQLWITYDPDTDRLLDQYEAALGTSTSSADTDGDGLNDGVELTITGTDPTVDDSASDLDEDGLTALEETAAGTNPLRPDTDGDTLDDRFELQEFTSDPRRQDTDADGLTDDSEFRLGTDPRNPDSDGDGMLDGQETYTSEAATTDGAVTVEITGIGDVARTIQFQPLISSTLLSGLPGQITPAVDITTDAPFDTARITMRFDPAQVPNGDVDNLRILYYDAADRVFKPTDGAYGVDAAAGIAWAETSHFTPFVLFSIPNWNSVWEYTMAPGRDSTDPVTTSLDVMLVLDSSGSMTRNDPQDLRKTAAKNFIDALLVGDQVGVVDFDSSATLLQSLTPLTETAKAAVDQIDSSGGTCIGDGIALATQEIVANSGADRLKAQIVLTDGEDSPSCNPDYAALLTAAGDAGIQIYTIGLGTDVDTALLQQMADDTGGQYFPISNADDLPEVFRRIAEGPDPDQDTDGDGLPDWLETQGIRRGNGTIVTTDPNNVDTDGDGLSDAEEVGTLQTGPDGDYYDGITDPRAIDTDNDGLSDDEELEIGTAPSRADTDGDGLEDLIEINANFDPFDPNPDGDHRGDYEEWVRDSDPFYYDKRAWDYAADFILGLVLGDAGENMASMGLISNDSIQSIGYLSGWIVSGLVLVGDIRDSIAALARGDLIDTVLNALGLIPLLGDGSKAARVIAEFLQWAPDLIRPVTRWIATTFADHPQVFTAAAAVVGFGGQRLRNLPANEIAQLAKADNRGDVLEEFLERGGEFISRQLSQSQVDDLYNNKVKVNLTVRLFSERVRKISPLAGQKRPLGKHLAPHGDENCRNVLHITEPCTPKWGECSKFCRFFRLKWDENSI